MVTDPYQQAVTVAGVELSPLQITFSFAAPKRTRMASSPSATPAATNPAAANQSSVVGRAVSALLAAAGISAANLVVPAFEGPPVAMAPEAVAAEWLEQLHTVVRKVCSFGSLFLKGRMSLFWACDT